jgi:hypothetical protein
LPSPSLISTISCGCLPSFLISHTCLRSTGCREQGQAGQQQNDDSKLLRFHSCISSMLSISAYAGVQT